MVGRVGGGVVKDWGGGFFCGSMEGSYLLRFGSYIISRLNTANTFKINMKKLTILRWFCIFPFTLRFLKLNSFKKTMSPCEGGGGCCCWWWWWLLLLMVVVVVVVDSGGGICCCWRCC